MLEIIPLCAAVAALIVVVLVAIMGEKEDDE